MKIPGPRLLAIAAALIGTRVVAGDGEVGQMEAVAAPGEALPLYTHTPTPPRIPRQPLTTAALPLPPRTPPRPWPPPATHQPHPPTPTSFQQNNGRGPIPFAHPTGGWCGGRASTNAPRRRGRRQWRSGRGGGRCGATEVRARYFTQRCTTALSRYPTLPHLTTQPPRFHHRPLRRRPMHRPIVHADHVRLVQRRLERRGVDLDERRR